MPVIQAKSAGFCYGVRRAVELAEKTARETGGCVMLGSIIHNANVVARLERLGARQADTPDQVCPGDTVIIRSHGVGKHIYDMLKAQGVRIVDATCPFVKKIHRIVQEQNLQGRRVIIIGDETHPEVEGIKGWGDARTMVVKNEEQMEKLPSFTGEKLCIVSQTTFNYNKFKELVEIIEKKSYDVSVLNTICNATKERQTEARSIAETVDAMIVIGDKHSSNTQKLFEICRKACNNTYYIQTLGDLDLNQLGSVETVGITAGASTPNNIIEEVQNNVRINF